MTCKKSKLRDKMVCINYIGGIKNNRRIVFRVPSFSSVFIVVFVFFLAILSGANTYNLDLEFSRYHFYNDSVVYQGEWLSYLTIKFARGIGVNFEEYRLFLYCFSFLLIYGTIRNSSKWTFLTLLLYCFYPFAVDVIQDANFYCSALFIYGTRWLADNDRLSSKIKYIVFVLLAAGFHVVGYVYLPLALLPNYHSDERGLQKIKKAFLFCLSFGVFFTVLDRLTNVFSNLIFLMVDDPRMAIYFSDTTRFGFLLFWLGEIGLFLMSYYGYVGVRSHDIYSDKQKKYAYAVCMISIYLLLLMPIICHSGTVFRIIRNCMILAYATWGLFCTGISDFKTKLLYKTFAFAFVLILFVFLLGTNVKENASSFLLNNWLLNG